MSTFAPHRFACPACGEAVEAEVCVGLNLARPRGCDEQIFERSFHLFPCPSCGARTRVESPVAVYDLKHRWLIFHLPEAEEARWPAWEEVSDAVWEQTLGAGAPPIARSLAAGFEVRVVFGAEALREKLVCRREMLDDRVVEVLKLDAMRSVSGLALDAARRPRLEGPGGDGLLFVVRDADGQEMGFDRPWPAYDAVDQDRDTWGPALAQFAGRYVDLGRLLVPAEPA